MARAAWDEEAVSDDGIPHGAGGLGGVAAALDGRAGGAVRVPFTTRPAQAGAVLGFFGHAVPIRGRVTEGNGWRNCCNG